MITKINDIIMKKKIFLLLSVSLCLCVDKVSAQIGAPYIHDPSTLAECDGKYYTFGTGGGGLISEDGWSWNSGADRPGGGAAPDVLKIGDMTWVKVVEIDEKGRVNLSRKEALKEMGLK